MKYSNIKLPSNKKFGYFFTVVFVISTIYFLYSELKTATYIMALVASLFFVITLINANLLLPLNKLWMKFGLLLGKIISPIVLGIIFLGLFTPYGIVMRIFGRDELRLKQIKKKSYWINRSKTLDKYNFKQQF